MSRDREVQGWSSGTFQHKDQEKKKKRGEANKMDQEGVTMRQEEKQSVCLGNQRREQRPNGSNAAVRSRKAGLRRGQGSWRCQRSLGISNQAVSGEQCGRKHHRSRFETEWRRKNQQQHSLKEWKVINGIVAGKGEQTCEMGALTARQIKAGGPTS